MNAMELARIILREVTETQKENCCLFSVIPRACFVMFIFTRVNVSLGGNLRKERMEGK